MNPAASDATPPKRLRGGARTRAISCDWRDEDVSTYLDRCQIDTPERLVAETWARVGERRASFGTVYDFGAGDGRFSRFGSYGRYVGFEIDLSRCGRPEPLRNVEFIHRCAFSEVAGRADLCIGNPPFVRNQDLPAGWRTKVADGLRARSGVTLSGLANAWQYFFLLALISANDDGLCALVIPYEWVSRPSSQALRDHIMAMGWEVDVHRLADASFESVLTTSSITIVDKSARTGRWRFFQETADSLYEPMPSASASPEGYLPYLRPVGPGAGPRAVRGLSPGSQKVFTLTEAERARCGLDVGRDVVACVTSLRCVPGDLAMLCTAAFKRLFRDGGRKCWLLRTDSDPSRKLAAYLHCIDEAERTSSTCTSRRDWWRYTLPPAPDALVATSFKGERPKLVTNSVGARAVGGVAGIHGLEPGLHPLLVAEFGRRAVADRIVAHANGLRKIEIHQLNGLLADIFRGDRR